jgi:hypothetical protein
LMMGLNSTIKAQLFPWTATYITVLNHTNDDFDIRIEQIRDDCFIPSPGSFPFSVPAGTQYDAPFIGPTYTGAFQAANWTNKGIKVSCIRVASSQVEQLLFSPGCFGFNQLVTSNYTYILSDPNLQFTPFTPNGPFPFISAFPYNGFILEIY